MPALCLLCACSMPALCLLYASSMPCTVPALCLLYPCFVPALCLLYACSVPAMCLLYPCFMLALCLLCACSMPALCLLWRWNGAAIPDLPAYTGLVCNPIKITRYAPGSNYPVIADLTLISRLIAWKVACTAGIVSMAWWEDKGKMDLFSLCSLTTNMQVVDLWLWHLAIVL